MGDIFSNEELNIIGSLVLGEKARTEQQMFKQKPIDPEWQKYFDTISGLIEKLKQMKN
jgi:hypothetical protein